MSTATAESVFTIDPRPLNERVKEAIKANRAPRAIGRASTTVGGAAIGGGISYLNYAVAIAIYSAIGAPAWVLTVIKFSCLFAVGYLACVGAWIGYVAWA